MKLFGSRANELSTDLALKNAARNIFRSRLNLLLDVRHSLHVVQFSRFANPLDDVVQRRSREAATIRTSCWIAGAMCKRLGSLIFIFRRDARLIATATAVAGCVNRHAGNGSWNLTISAVREIGRATPSSGGHALERRHQVGHRVDHQVRARVRQRLSRGVD
jgi:hypothetical protein